MLWKIFYDFFLNWTYIHKIDSYVKRFSTENQVLGINGSNYCVLKKSRPFLHSDLPYKIDILITWRRPSSVLSWSSGSESCCSMWGRISSNALDPTVVCSASKVLAAATRTSRSGSQRDRRTVGTRLSTKDMTISREVEVRISDRPTHTPCRLSASPSRVEVQLMTRPE